ncbi:cAMP-specific 3',5'-cyclic phosphodiesterase 4D, partial [Dinochytrium kinnereticum]
MAWDLRAREHHHTHEAHIPRSPTAVRIEEGNPFSDEAADEYVDYGDTCSTSSLTDVQELSLDRSVRSRNSNQLPYPATASSPPSSAPASDYLMRSVNVLQNVWRGMMVSTTHEEVEMSDAKRANNHGKDYDFDPASEKSRQQRTRSLSLAYLQDPSPLFPTDGSLASADSAATAHPHLEDPSRPSSHFPPPRPSSSTNYHTPTSPSMLVPTLDSHTIAALRLKHARFSTLTLRFLDDQVEQDYGVYFWGRSVTRWRTFVAVAGALGVSYQCAAMLGKGGDVRVSAGMIDWVVLGIAAVLPMIAIGMSTFFVKKTRISRWIHHLSFLFLVLLGPVLTCIRYVHPSGETGPQVSPAVTAPLYIVCLVASVFFLRLRFVYTLLATLVAAPTWYAVFGSDVKNSGGGEGVLGQYIVASVALFLACIVTCSIAYDLERTLRTQYLSDSRFLSITRNLQSQLEGLERSLLAASGRQDLTPADLDSPLEKAMLAVRSLLMDPTVRRQHKNVLDVVMACLSSPNLLTPDLDLQVKRGQVEMDVEVEKWLFSEVARRKGLGEADPEGVGKEQVVGDWEDGGGVIQEEEEEDEDVFADSNKVVEEADVQLIAVAAESTATQDLTSTYRHHNHLHQIPLTDTTTATSPPPTPLFRHRRRSSSAIPLIPTLTMDQTALSTLLNPRTEVLLKRIGEFNFPIFEFADVTEGHPLLVMANHLLVGGGGGVVGRLGLDVGKFLNCMATVEAGYHADLAFHNSLHAADVLHCIHYLTTLSPLNTMFTDLETLSILLAAIIHDFDHPGVNNHFLIASSDRRALLYNDQSVLENHHCSAAFEVISRRECGFLSTLDRSEYRALRENVVEMVLATDLAKHFEVLTMFKKKVLTGDTFDPVGVREDRTLLMKMLMKCADVSNPTKAWPEYSEWITRITLEWFTQGDREKALGLPVSPFCNRDGTTATHPAPSQASFIDFIVSPLFDAFHAWTDLGEVKRGLDANRAKWAAVIAAEKSAEEAGKTEEGRAAGGTPVKRVRNKSVPHLPGLVTGSPLGRSKSQHGAVGSPRRGHRRRSSTPLEGLSVLGGGDDEVERR